MLLGQRQDIVNRATSFTPTEVTVAEFPIVVANYVAMFNEEFRQRQAELNEIRQQPEMNSIELLRLYEDVFAAQERTALIVAKLMEASAKLGIAETVARLRDGQIDVVVYAVQAALDAAGVDTDAQMFAARSAFLAALRSKGEEFEEASGGLFY